MSVDTIGDKDDPIELYAVPFIEGMDFEAFRSVGAPSGAAGTTILRFPATNGAPSTAHPTITVIRVGGVPGGAGRFNGRNFSRARPISCASHALPFCRGFSERTLTGSKKSDAMTVSSYPARISPCRTAKIASDREG